MISKIFMKQSLIYRRNKIEGKELEKLKIMDHPYLDSFVREDEFQNKRFGRYLKRIETQLFEFVTNNTPDKIKETILENL